MTNRFGFANLGLGLGLRGPHIDHVMATKPDVGFFEIISENYLVRDPARLRRLEAIRATYPVVLHGVSLSIGSTDPIDFAYLAALKDLARRIDAAWVSDHLCFTGVSGLNTHDLLPIPYTDEALRHVAARIRAVSDFLERPLAIENPSSYVTFAESRLGEADFLATLAEEADCGLLVDVNNVYVSARNHGFDAAAWIDRMPADRVVQVHLAGHTDKGTHILDTHSDYVAAPVWDLYGRLVRRTGPVASMVEWDADIPAFEVVHAEIEKARRFITSEVAVAA